MVPRWAWGERLGCEPKQRARLVSHTQTKEGHSCADKRAPRPSVITSTCAAALTLCWWAGLSSGHSSLVDCNSILRSCWPRCLVLHCRLPFGFSGSPWRRKRDGKVLSGSGEGEEDPTDFRCSLNRCRLSEMWEGIAEENFLMESPQNPSERTGIAREKERLNELILILCQFCENLHNSANCNI